MSIYEDRDGTAHPTKRERFMLWARGWSAGAAARAIAQQDADYTAGWAAGADARKHALADFARRIGYKPTVLRVAGDWVQCTSVTNDCLGGCRTAEEHQRYNAVSPPVRLP